MTRLSALALALAGVVAAGCSSDDTRTARTTTGGDPARGKRAIRRYGCGTCHEIPEVGAATGHVGPSLAQIGSRLYLAGRLPNTPDHLIDWIRQPQHVEPGNVMPDMGVTPGDASDIAAFLYTLR
jgi:cytochrome c